MPKKVKGTLENTHHRLGKFIPTRRRERGSSCLFVIFGRQPAIGIEAMVKKDLVGVIGKQLIISRIRLQYDRHTGPLIIAAAGIEGFAKSRQRSLYRFKNLVA